MGSLGRRLRHLETERTREESELTREALGRLSDGDLDALEELLLEDGQEEDGTAAFEELYGVVTERGRRALENLFAALEAVKADEEPRASPEAEIREEDMRQRLEEKPRNGYRIRKYGE